MVDREGPHTFDAEQQFMGVQEMREAQQPQLTAVRIVDGLGFGDGNISFKAREHEVGPESLAAAEAVINSDAILIPIGRDSDGNAIEDDGCGDGREVGAVLFGHDEIQKPSLDRAKVFGGGATMAVAARIAVDGLTAPTLNDEFNMTMDELDEKLVGFGAHTDQHAKGENCGCGAIDKAPTIIENAVKFREQIEASIEALGIPTDGLDVVFDNYAKAADAISPESYSGKKVSEKVKSHDKITKVLSADHREMFIVLNTQPGTTVNQEATRSVTDGDVQVFATDVWRLQEIAERMYPDDPAAQRTALHGELVYTLATAATLTAGDLPVYVLKTT